MAYSLVASVAPSRWTAYALVGRPPRRQALVCRIRGSHFFKHRAPRDSSGATGVLALPLARPSFSPRQFFLFLRSGRRGECGSDILLLPRQRRTHTRSRRYLFSRLRLRGYYRLGSGGLALDALGAVGLSHALAFRIFFAVLLLVLVWVLARMGLSSAWARSRCGSRSASCSRYAICEPSTCSPASTRAPTRRRKLPLSAELARASGAAQAGLLAYLGSPRFDVRLEALLAIENMGALAEGRRSPRRRSGAPAVHDRLPRGAHSRKTASEEPARRARVLAALRLAMAAQDYMLQASAMVALARLGDRESVAAIEDISPHRASEGANIGRLRPRTAWLASLAARFSFMLAPRTRSCLCLGRALAVDRRDRGRHAAILRLYQAFMETSDWPVRLER